MLRKCRRFGLRMGIAMLAVLATATLAHAHGSRPSRALMRCQEQIASEGLYYSTRLNVKLARCLVPLGTCSVQTGGASHACDRAVARCLALPGDVAGIEGRFVSRVRSSCNGLGMSQLLSDLDFNSQVGECNPQDLMQFARCLAGNLKQAEVLAVLRLAPSACDFASTPGLADVLPAAACNPSDACDDDDDPPPPPPTCEGQLYCGGADSVACPDGMVCDKVDGLCSETADGVCVPATTCSDEGTPVCGCDGRDLRLRLPARGRGGDPGSGRGLPRRSHDLQHQPRLRRGNLLRLPAGELRRGPDGHVQDEDARQLLGLLRLHRGDRVRLRRQHLHLRMRPHGGR